MNVRELQDRLMATVPNVRLPRDAPVDDLYPFRFASVAFVPPFMDALTRVLEGAGNAAGADGYAAAERRLVALAGLLEEVLTGGDDDMADALAMRLVHTRLCARPEVTAGVWPYLGERSRRVAGKFLALAQDCDRREAALRAGQP